MLELERMVPDDVSAEAVQAELDAFVTALGIEAERTKETYDSRVRAAPGVASAGRVSWRHTASLPTGR